jgi:Lysyl oxidase
VRGALLRLVPAVVAIAAIVPGAIAMSGPAPTPGTPLLPDLEQETPSGLVLTKPSKRSEWRLGFRSAVRNVGAGPLIIDGRRAMPDHDMAAEQVIVNQGAPRTVVPDAGMLRYVRSPDHKHWHLLGFDQYALRRPGGRTVVRDRKSGFCLGDRYEVSVSVPLAAARAPEPLYTSRCGLDQPGRLGIREGISVGYGDDYAANLEGQYLPLDGLRAGRYELVHTVNADQRLRESSYENNEAAILLRLRWRRGVPQIRVLRYRLT